jgi:hypothetical protein
MAEWAAAKIAVNFPFYGEGGRNKRASLIPLILERCKVFCKSYSTRRIGLCPLDGRMSLFHPFLGKAVNFLRIAFDARKGADYDGQHQD